MTDVDSDDTPASRLNALAEAAERRNIGQVGGASGKQLLQEHERRQMFRRLINPGIYRPNPEEVAVASLKARVLSTLAENLLRDPDNPKFRQFKTTNTTIERNLVKPKGALEYAIALGFRPEVKEFQPYYAWNKHRMEDLRAGAAILKEALDTEAQKQQRSNQSKQTRKEAAEEVKLAFLDDRMSKSLRDQMEREAREARLARGSSGRNDNSESIGELLTPIAGSASLDTLDRDGNTDNPPPYQS
ncbi:hypothetical protein CONPUDRAFT_64629 [Coniophora puteana RWD-64-598 SS2]|uniref:PUB domain-containing protein n=1 Tax=Coniophora puteana (strain RWD-64-598) TaxID=741705 RepID=A0A5M3MBX0_CONPW|nr:uncharacterized protein CONPUDRAFT_64629 [Coniophora puteana RWD-64-598 SS2]EIW76131.1 hypothetical protein CONPUDRAFT_64629 [Coniophora puteana RWD-64-598 SS2]